MAADAGLLPAVAVPGDGRITLTDYGYRDWGPEVVRYRLDTNRFPPGQLALTNEDNKPVPLQIAKFENLSVLSFVATVPKGKTATYTLKPSEVDRSREGATLQDRPTGETRWQPPPF